METVIANIESEDLFNSYQIVERVDMVGDKTYRIWVSTGPISGYLIKQKFETLGEAFRALVELFEEREEQVF